MVEPFIDSKTGEIYNKHTGLFLGISSLIMFCSTIIMHYISPKVIQYICFCVGCYLLPLGLYGSTKSCTKNPFYINLISLSICICSVIFMIFF